MKEGWKNNYKEEAMQSKYHHSSPNFWSLPPRHKAQRNVRYHSRHEGNAMTARRRHRSRNQGDAMRHDFRPPYQSPSLHNTLHNTRCSTLRRDCVRSFPTGSTEVWQGTVLQDVQECHQIRSWVSYVTLVCARVLSRFTQAPGILEERSWNPALLPSCSQLRTEGGDYTSCLASE